jgi:hypothetical protein
VPNVEKIRGLNLAGTPKATLPVAGYLYFLLSDTFYMFRCLLHHLQGTNYIYKVKGVPRQAEVTLGVPGRLRPQIFSTFGTTRVVDRQPNSPAAFTPRKIPGTHFHSTSGHMVLSEGTTEKIPSDTIGDRSRDLPTSSAAP